MRRRGLLTGLLIAITLVTGCASAKQKVSEFALRNVAAIGGTAAFEDNKVDVNGTLACTAKTAPDGKTGLVSCTGTAKDGRPLTLVGSYDAGGSKNKVKGTFTGKAGDTVVFSKNCLGNGC
jgi:hypothetical protein